MTAKNSEGCKPPSTQPRQTKDATREARTVPEAILARAGRYPDRVAVRDDHSEVTYGQLAQRALALARVIHSAAPDAEPLVAVLQPRTADALVAEFAIWLAGAAYLPIDTQLPPSRIAQVMAEAHCTIAVSDAFAEKLPPGTRIISCRDSAAGDLPSVTPHDLSYVIYTSGSTGRPKGVEVEHGSLLTWLEWYVDFFGLHPGLNCGVLVSMGFDVARGACWGPLLAGATVVFAQPEEIRDPSALLNFLDQAQIHHAFFPTPLLETLLQAGLRPRFLRSLGVAGDRLRVWPPAEFPAAVHNLYGPTEATIAVTATADLRTVQRVTATPPIGGPVAGTHVTLVEEDGNIITSPGVAGELLLGGPLLARGYRRTKEHVEGAFGYSPGTGGRFYRTGDICRWTTADCEELEFVGRRDRQVKIRGNRLELQEVEATLLAAPGVEQAVAAVVEKAGQPSLVCWIVGAATSHDVRSFLRTRLPSYMVPGSVVHLPNLPTTVNGKLDRAALVLPFAATADGPDHALTLAEQVANVWSEMTGTLPGPDDDFFDIGGDSILAVQMVSRVAKSLGLPVKVSMLLRNPRFDDYVRRVSELRESSID